MCATHAISLLFAHTEHVDTQKLGTHYPLAFVTQILLHRLHSDTVLTMSVQNVSVFTLCMSRVSCCTSERVCYIYGCVVLVIPFIWIAQSVKSVK